MDFDKLSDAELEKLAGGDFSSVEPKPAAQASSSPHDLDSMSDAELEKLAGGDFSNIEGKPHMSTFNAVRHGVETGGTFGLDPIIAGAGGAIGEGLGALYYSKDVDAPILDKLKNAYEGMKDGYNHARHEQIEDKNQAFAEHPKAFLGGTLAGAVMGGNVMGPLAKMGSTAAGAVSGFADSESNTIGGQLQDAAMGGAQGFALGMAGKGAGMVASKVANSAAGKAATNAVKNIASQALGRTSDLGKKFVSAVSGVPTKDLETFSKDPEKVLAFAKKYAPGEEGIAEAADDLRSRWKKNIDLAKQRISAKITPALDAIDTKFSTKDIVADLEAAKARLHPKTQLSEIDDVDELLGVVKSFGDEVGAHDLQAIKTYLQDNAAFRKAGQFMSPRGKAAQLAAAKAQGRARLMLANESPVLAQANKSLAELHNIERKITKNLITTEKPYAGIVSAGNGTNANNRRMLGKLGGLTGTDMVGDAEMLSAARTFSNPEFLNLERTGKAVLRTAAGGGAGYAVGGDEGAMVGAALSSPAALKQLIRGKAAVGRALTTAGEHLEPALARALPSMKNVETSIGSFGGQLGGIRPLLAASNGSSGDDSSRAAQLRDMLQRYQALKPRKPSSEEKPESHYVPHDEAKRRFEEGN